jgi:hypothetical protein
MGRGCVINGVENCGCWLTDCTRIIPRLLPYFHIASWKIEKKRFLSKGKSHWSLGNRILWVWFAYVVLLAFFALTYQQH